MRATDPLPVMGTRLDLISAAAQRRVRRTMARRRGWAGTIEELAASFLDAQLESIDAAVEYLASLVLGPVAVNPAPFLGQLGTQALQEFLDVTPDAVNARVAGGMDPDEALERSTTMLVDRVAIEPHIVGRDVVATIANNDPRFVGYARVANPGACDWCKMLAGRGAVYTENTATKTRDGQPYHRPQPRLRKDGSTYMAGGVCQCTMMALPKGGKVEPAPDDVPRAKKTSVAQAYRKGATTPQRAASVARQLEVLRAQKAAGQATDWTSARIAELEAEQAAFVLGGPRSAALRVLVRRIGMRYDPNQPRDPKGVPTGGQWTDSKTAKGGDGESFDWAAALTPVAAPDLETAAKQAKAKVAEEAAWAQVKLNNSEAANLKRTAAAGVAARMSDVPADRMAAALRAVDDTDELGLQIALDEIDAAVGTPDEPHIHLARDLDGNYYSAYKGEAPIKGWTYARPGTPEFDSMVREGAVAGFIDKWAQTSNDHDDGSLAIQAAIRREFGIEDSAGWTSSGGDGTVILREHGAVLQRYARAMYDNTQADLAARGVTEVTVHRGTGIPLGDEPKYLTGAGRTTVLRPASSWSTDKDVAWEFAAIAQDQGTATAILTVTVPASRVLSTPNSGIGCLSEAEVVLLGGTLDVTVERL